MRQKLDRELADFGILPVDQVIIIGPALVAVDAGLVHGVEQCTDALAIARLVQRVRRVLAALFGGDIGLVDCLDGLDGIVAARAEELAMTLAKINAAASRCERFDMIASCLNRAIRFRGNAAVKAENQPASKCPRNAAAASAINSETFCDERRPAVRTRWIGTDGGSKSLSMRTSLPSPTAASTW